MFRPTFIIVLIVKQVTVINSMGVITYKIEVEN
jgi:hypothetical protein